MAKGTPAQKEVVERVMHEWKHGELETPAGDKVTDRKQAIAIGLSEAGESNRQSPAENRKRLKETKSRERKGKTGRAEAEGNPTKAELYAQARKKGVEGRSRMSKDELREAVKD